MKFDEWFYAQYGKRPGRVSDDDLKRNIAFGKHCEQVIADRKEWDVKYDAALKAWQAKAICTEAVKEVKK